MHWRTKGIAAVIFSLFSHFFFPMPVLQPRNFDSSCLVRKSKEAQKLYKSIMSLLGGDRKNRVTVLSFVIHQK